MKTLTLLIPSDWPEQRRDCPWLLHDAGGQLLEQGCSEPAHWPKKAVIPSPSAQPQKTPASADEPLFCNLVLCGEQVSGHGVMLPKTDRGRSAEVIAAALEDSLLEDASELQFAVPPSAVVDGENASVGVVTRLRLMTLCQVIEPLGLTLRSAWPLSFCLPPEQAALMTNQLTLNLPKGGFITLDLNGQLSAWLDSLAHEGVTLPLPCVVLERQSNNNTESALLHQADPRLQIIQSISRLTVPEGAGFLYGDLAPPDQPSTLRRDLRTAAKLAMGLTLVATLLAALQWGWFSWQAKQYRQEIERNFRLVLPQGAMVAPLLQMQRQVDAQLHATGQLGTGDFLRLLAPLAELPGSPLQLQALNYDKGLLRVAGQLTDEALQALTEDCRRRRLTVNVLAQDKLVGGNRVELEISEGIK